MDVRCDRAEMHAAVLRSQRGRSYFCAVFSLLTITIGDEKLASLAELFASLT
jgi:hypothetical protein